MTTTNYYDTFIEVAEDCPTAIGETPPRKANSKSVANIQHDMLIGNPYKYTSDDALFGVFAERNAIPGNKLSEEREKFFSKGQPCFRASPLTKRYGWGVHSNAEGRIAIYAMESKDYRRFVADPGLKQLKAMRSKRA
jgi:hypothetical protein